MKTILLVLLLLFSINVYGQKFSFEPRGALDYYVGGSKYGLEIIHSPYFETLDLGNFRVRIGGTLKYKKFGLYFDQEVYMSNESIYQFSPSAAKWSVGLEYSINNKIKINYEHSCTHPVLTDTRMDFTRVYGGSSMFSISYGY